MLQVDSALWCKKSMVRIPRELPFFTLPFPTLPFQDSLETKKGGGGGGGKEVRVINASFFYLNLMHPNTKKSYNQGESKVTVP